MNSVIVYPVIHHLNDATSLEQAQIAHECGAAGVFLISHHNQDSELPGLGVKIKNLYPHDTFKVGLNFLSKKRDVHRSNRERQSPRYGVG